MTGIEETMDRVTGGEKNLQRFALLGKTYARWTEKSKIQAYIERLEGENASLKYKLAHPDVSETPKARWWEFWKQGENQVKTLILIAVMFMAAQSSFAAYQGKLDLSTNFQAIGMRELHDGQWLAGVGKKFWSLQKDGVDRFGVSAISAWNAEKGNNLYGLSVGVNIPGAIHDSLQALVPDLTANVDSIKWLGQLGNILSIDIMGGYRPSHSSDVHTWGYGIGAYVTVPLDLIKGL